MKVAVLSRNFKASSGGGENYAVSLTSKLSYTYDVHVFSQSYNKINNITFHKVPTPVRHPRWINILWFNMYTWAKCKNFPIIHTHEMVPFANIVTMHVRCSTPDFSQYTSEKRLLKKIKFYSSIRKLVYLWIEKKQLKQQPGKSIIVVSDILKKNIDNVYKQDTSQYKIIPPATNTPRILNKKIARNNLGIPDKHFYLLMVSNDFISKGLAPLIKSLTFLPIKIHLLVAGNDKQEPFERLANELNVAHRIHFLGTRDDMSTVYSSCDTLVHPSTYDTYSMVALEAMSYGKPVIISNKKYCGISYELTNEAILLNNPNDPNEIANSVLAIHSSEKTRINLIRNGKKFAADRSWEVLKERYIKIYNQTQQFSKNSMSIQ